MMQYSCTLQTYHTQKTKQIVMTSYADATTNICNQGLRLYYIFTFSIVLKLLIFFPQRNFYKVQVQIKCSISKLNFEHTNVLKYIII